MARAKMGFQKDIVGNWFGRIICLMMAIHYAQNIYVLASLNNLLHFKRFWRRCTLFLFVIACWAERSFGEYCFGIYCKLTFREMASLDRKIYK